MWRIKRPCRNGLKFPNEIPIDPNCSNGVLRAEPAIWSTAHLKSDWGLASYLWHFTGPIQSPEGQDIPSHIAQSVWSISKSLSRWLERDCLQQVFWWIQLRSTHCPIFTAPSSSCRTGVFHRMPYSLASSAASLQFSLVMVLVTIAKLSEIFAAKADFDIC